MIFWISASACICGGLNIQLTRFIASLNTGSGVWMKIDGEGADEHDHERGGRQQRLQAGTLQDGADQDGHHRENETDD